MPQLEQDTAATVAKYQSRNCTATFRRPTTPGRLIVVICSTAGALPVGLYGPAGFTQIAVRGLRDIEVGVWYLQNAPATTSVSVSFQGWTPRSLQVRALEFSGIAQSNALDKVVAVANEYDRIYTGATGTIAQADELVLAVVANQYASTEQSGFTGGLTRLFESVSPETWHGGGNFDWERSRLSVHQAVTVAATSFSLSALLSSTRRWCSFIITFRGQSTGPARFTSRNAPPMIDTAGGSASLTVFGPLKSNDPTLISPMVVTSDSGIARVGPYNYQYRLGGWGGLLIGSDTPYRVEELDGLEGWTARVSDAELPRGDGAIRGADLQSARLILFKVNTSGTQAEVETRMDILYRTLTLQRDSDWPLIWRHPGRPLRVVYCRPVELARELTFEHSVGGYQEFALRAADPRHYSARTHEVTVPVSSPTAVSPIVVTAINEGNGPAYPTIRIVGPPTGNPVTKVSLLNQSTDIAFDVASLLPAGATLVGDMPARATGAARSIVTINGQSKYGAWQHPRRAFAINPGVNELVLYTEPPSSPVTATISYPDTWAG